MRALPSAQAVVAMVGEGWEFEALMRLPAREFSFWLDEQAAFAKRRAQEEKKRHKR